MYKELIIKGQKLIKVLDQPATWVYVPENATEEFIAAKRKKYQDEQKAKNKAIYDSFSAERKVKVYHTIPGKTYLPEYSITDLMNNLRH